MAITPPNCAQACGRHQAGRRVAPHGGAKAGFGTNPFTAGVPLKGRAPLILDFATLTGANRYAVLYRIGAVKRPETRARKIAEFVAMLERGETVHG